MYQKPKKVFPRIVVDVETTSELDLKRVGAYKYATHPSTRVLCVCYTIVHKTYQEETRNWFPGDPVPTPFELKEGQLYPVLVAHNAAFERLIFKHQLEVYGFSRVPDISWSCTMLRAAYHGYPMGLDAVAEAMNLPFGKDKEGHRVMLQMSRPRTKSPLTWWDETDPEKFKRLVSYCRQDVAVEQILDHYLPELPLREHTYWMLDLKMNDDGLPLDMDRVHDMIATSDKIAADLDQSMNLVTSGAVPDTRKVAKLKEWAAAKHGFNITTLNKDKIDDVIAAAKMLGPSSSSLVRAIELRKIAAKSSIAKLNSMVECSDGGRARGVFQFYGATRTGRYAGRLIQPQNFPRPTHTRDDIEASFLMGSGFNLGLLSSALRSCIKPRQKENSLVVVDFSQIEARVLVWLAGQEDVIEAFANGEDVYTLQANKLRSQDRTLGKVVQLACGYGMGGPKFQETAAKFGIDLTEDAAKNLVWTWRDANPKIPELWKNIETLAFQTVNLGPKYAFGNGRLEFSRIATALGGDQLEIRLPSGRRLTYLDPQVIDGDLTYMGMNQYTRKWERIKTYGGKLVENIVQAAARDLLMELMRLADKPSWARLIGTVHDEVIVECPTRYAQTHLDTLINACKRGFMSEWTNGLPLDAEGSVMARYGK